MVKKTTEQQTALRGQNQSTLSNYLRPIAAISLHFNRLPEHFSDNELNEYLVSLALAKNSPSRSNFKHMVYGLRYYYRHIGEKNALLISSAQILKRTELKQLFSDLLKHRFVINNQLILQLCYFLLKSLSPQ